MTIDVRIALTHLWALYYGCQSLPQEQHTAVAQACQSIAATLNEHAITVDLCARIVQHLAQIEHSATTTQIECLYAFTYYFLDQRLITYDHAAVLASDVLALHVAQRTFARQLARWANRHQRLTLDLRGQPRGSQVWDIR